MGKASTPSSVAARRAVYVTDEMYARLQEHRQETGLPLTYMVKEGLALYFELEAENNRRRAKRVRAVLETETA